MIFGSRYADGPMHLAGTMDDEFFHVVVREKVVCYNREIEGMAERIFLLKFRLLPLCYFLILSLFCQTVKIWIYDYDGCTIFFLFSCFLSLLLCLCSMAWAGGISGIPENFFGLE